LVRCIRPCESQAWIVHFEIPPSRRAASFTEINISKFIILQRTIDKGEYRRTIVTR